MLASAGKPKRRPWTEGEDALVRRLYRVNRASLRAALPHRTAGAIQLRASSLGASIRPHWSVEDDEELTFFWNSGDSISKLASKLGRTEKAVYERAQKLSLAIGCPPGFEYLLDAMKRAGFTNLAAFRELLRRAGVTIRMSMSDPHRRGIHRRRFVDPFDVDEAVAQWVGSETINCAARTRGLVGVTLTKWLVDAGLVEAKRATRSHRRVPSGEIDRVVAERRSA